MKYITNGLSLIGLFFIALLVFTFLQGNLSLSVNGECFVCSDKDKAAQE